VLCAPFLLGGWRSRAPRFFIELNRDELIARTSGKVASHPFESREPRGDRIWGPPVPEQAHGDARTGSPFPPNAIGSAAAKHGQELLGMGFTAAQVVHDYGDICQTITELAIERNARITAEDFHTLNRCLDTAIAEAVSEYGAAAARSERGRGGASSGPTRSRAPESGPHRSPVAPSLAERRRRHRREHRCGATRSVVGLRDLIDSALAEVRLEAVRHQPARVSLRGFVGEIAMAARLHADSRKVQLVVESVDPALAINVDPQLLTSALMNLLHNAFEYTHLAGRVVPRTRSEPGPNLIDVEDQCGGLPETDNLFRSFGDQRSSDRSGLGLGLSISRRAVAASGGEIRALSLPGQGCVFTSTCRRVPRSGQSWVEPI
jgi:signal transduction histidine kinase